MSIYPKETTIHGGNVQFGDIYNYHHQTYHVPSRIDDDRSILAWLSSLNFGEVLRRHCNKRTLGTGNWLVEHHNYRSWHASEVDKNRFLWCRGNPGTGKTILCSMVIEQLRSATPDDGALMYCFFDYARRQELSADKIIADFMVQLSSRRAPQVLTAIRSLYDNADCGRRGPTLRELTTALHQTIAAFRKVFVVVDALDECDPEVRRQLLNALDLLSNQGLRILVFSRPHIHFHTYISRTHIQICEIDIQASASDLHLFVECRISEIDDLEHVIDSCDLTVGKIADIIVRKASFSFLAAEMRLNAIGFVITAEDLTTALESGLSDPTALYNETLSRISGQHKQKVDLALRALGWLAIVKRPLTIRELCHVLALQPGKQTFSTAQMPAADVVINSCFGLIVRDPYNEQVRLLHYTLLEFMERHDLMSVSHEAVVEVCLTCLSAKELEELAFTERPRGSRLAAIHMRIFRVLPFTSYAANYWLDHMCTEFEILDFLIEFLVTPSKVTSWLRILDFHDPKRLRELCTGPIFSRDPCADTLPGIRVALVMGWQITVRQLMESARTIEADLRTMVTNTIEEKSLRLLEILLTHGLDPSSTDAKGEALVHQAVLSGFPAGISILARYGADLNQRASNQQTPLQVSILTADEDCSAALIRAGASVDDRDENGKTILTMALCYNPSQALVSAILNSKPLINSKDALGETQLHQVLRYCDDNHWQISIVRNLLNEEANVAARTVDGHTTLHYACIWSSPPEVVSMILIQYANILSRDRGESSFHDDQSELSNGPLPHMEHERLHSVIDRYAEYLRDQEMESLVPTNTDCVEEVATITFESILRCGSFVGHFDKCHRSPLHRAVVARRKDILASLLTVGLDADVQDRDGKTPLHLALEMVRLDEDYAQLLLRYTHILNARDLADRSILECAITYLSPGDLVLRLLPAFAEQHSENGYMSNGNSFLIGAIKAGYSFAVIKEILVRLTTDVNSRDEEGNTAVAIAAFRCQQDLVLLLLSFGADPSIHNMYGFSAVHRLFGHDLLSGGLIDTREACAPSPFAIYLEAYGSNHAATDTIHELLKRGADVNAEDSKGRTALHIVVTSIYPFQLIEDIATRTRNIDQKDRYGNTALHTAVLSILNCGLWELRSHFVETAKCLLRRNARTNLWNYTMDSPLHILLKHTSSRNLMINDAVGHSVSRLFDTFLSDHGSSFVHDPAGRSVLSVILDAWYPHGDPPPPEGCLLDYFEKTISNEAIVGLRSNGETHLESLTDDEMRRWNRIIGQNPETRELTDMLLELQVQRACSREMLSKSAAQGSNCS